MVNDPLIPPAGNEPTAQKFFVGVGRALWRDASYRFRTFIAIVVSFIIACFVLAFDRPVEWGRLIDVALIWLAVFLGAFAYHAAERAFAEAKRATIQSAAAARSAQEAAIGATAALRKLTDFGLAASDSENSFARVFEKHLVNQLERFQDSPGRAFLLLSTPAYGYGVVGPKRFESFSNALRRLHAGCQLEVIMFSPDDHYEYWANIMLWGAVRDKAGNGFDEFSLQFAAKIRDVLDCLRAQAQGDLKSCKIWITRATTVRLFAYFGENGSVVVSAVRNPAAKSSSETSDTNVATPDTAGALDPVVDNPLEEVSSRVFVVLTDAFSLSLDQYEAGFKCRSMRVSSVQHIEFVERDDSYFERTKICPYTGRRGRDAAIEHKQLDNLIDALLFDYVFGCTAAKQVEQEALLAELKLYLRAATTAMGTREEVDVLRAVLQSLVKYFDEASAVYQRHASPSARTRTARGAPPFEKGHAARLRGAFENAHRLLSHAEAFNESATLARELSSWLGASGLVAVEEPGSSVEEANALQSCIREFLTSGIGASRYAKGLRDNGKRIEVMSARGAAAFACSPEEQVVRSTTVETMIPAEQHPLKALGVSKVGGTVGVGSVEGTGSTVNESKPTGSPDVKAIEQSIGTREAVGGTSIDLKPGRTTDSDGHASDI